MQETFWIFSWDKVPREAQDYVSALIKSGVMGIRNRIKTGDIFVGPRMECEVVLEKHFVVHVSPGLGTVIVYWNTGERTNTASTYLPSMT